MKITFIEDHISRLSGHSYYNAGTQADLRHGAELAKQGIVYEGWGSRPTAIDSIQGQKTIIITPDFATLDIEELREIAKGKGIKGYARMKKATLIGKLSK